ncbi:MaoC family dehydratase [Aestuariivirga litoralis]|uniref:MaoC family dehydratase n=1 Tax=Aestuariivirga litoralis TaxID=2650924 RepID=UPI0018C4E788|nr:MaoC family dehydratase [Aestuariivirga litoralis]MBG1232433.1 MaoC family dehydratase [Aestuariivirga litoralis]
MSFSASWNLGVMDQAKVRAFADASRDHNEIHLSAEAAAKAGLPDGPIVHGMLIYGAVESRLREVPGFSPSKFSMQFIKPLLVGAVLHAEARTLKEEQGSILLRLLCRNGDQQLIAIAEATLLARKN